MGAEAGSGIPEMGRKVREKVKGEETLVTKIPEIGKSRKQSGHGLARMHTDRKSVV